MQTKIRQITDSIHGTIYISELEHMMMSTPFFYRLNDVYQSSTVYMTYPSNRTKRYEHSLGTMELAGQMFYACVTNASAEDQNKFLDQIKSLFEEILHCLEERNDLAHIDIYKEAANPINDVIPTSICNLDAFLNLLNQTKKETPIRDHALCKQDVCFYELIKDDSDSNALKTIALYTFLYQCILEALRIAALFHDIGHPPFSHIIEFTLKKLYEKENKKYNKSRYEVLKKYLRDYVERRAVKDLLLDICDHKSTIDNSALHEQIGSHLLYNAYSGILKKQFKEWTLPDRGTENDSLRAIYLVTVLEFTFGILMEKAPILASVHRLVDGPIDADRLDYIVRDSGNSGVDWGEITYSRLISAAKFVYDKHGVLQIAFPEKICDDLDDMFVNRYKIFQRINYHHKSVKTSELLQRSVEMLAEDYLLTSKGHEIAPDIHKLWTSLGASFGQNAVENQISQWTDSWLISVLSQALSTLSDTNIRRNLVDESIGRTSKKLDKLYRMLEEVQLNRRRYFPLLKRQRDALYLRDRIIEKAGINPEALCKISMHEYEKLSTKTGVDADSARESLYRIELLQEKILRVADFSLLDTVMHCDQTFKEIVEDVLESAALESKITDFFLWQNTGFTNLGVSPNAEIVLYRANGEIYTYDKTTSLFPKLRAQKAGCLWMYVYVCLPLGSENEYDKILNELFDAISDRMAKNINAMMNSLFDFEKLTAKSKEESACAK